MGPSYLYIWAIAIKAHPTLICDLCDFGEVVILKFIKADVMGQPEWKGRLGWEGQEEDSA